MNSLQWRIPIEKVHCTCSRAGFKCMYAHMCVCMNTAAGMQEDEGWSTSGWQLDFETIGNVADWDVLTGRGAEVVNVLISVIL